MGDIAKIGEPIVDAEIVVEPGPLAEREAKALDEQIRTTSKLLAQDVDLLLNLLERAEAGDIHVALGFASWTAYVKDAVQFAPTDKDERKMLVSLMSGKGMSQRAIAGTLGVGLGTVNRDIESGNKAIKPPRSGHDNHSARLERQREWWSESQAEGVPSGTPEDDKPCDVIGLDGKTYKPKPEPKQPKEPDPHKDLDKRTRALVSDIHAIARGPLSQVLQDARDLRDSEGYHDNERYRQRMDAAAICPLKATEHLLLVIAGCSNA
jgi:hypothetical protein